MKLKNILLGILVLMCFYDFSLHFVEFGGIISYHPLYPNFGENFKWYDIFWMLYWETATVLSLLILQLGVKEK